MTTPLRPVDRPPSPPDSHGAAPDPPGTAPDSPGTAPDRPAARHGSRMAPLVRPGAGSDAPPVSHNGARPSGVVPPPSGGAPGSVAPRPFAPPGPGCGSPASPRASFPSRSADAAGSDPAGGPATGLVQRVQRRLASAGPIVADVGGLRAAVAGALRDEGILLPPASFAATVRSISDELAGLGPLAPLLADPTVTDVLVNGPSEVWVERDGGIERTPVRLSSAAAVTALVQRVVAPLGLRVDEARPWVDARLPGGERFHAVLPPLAPDGPVVTIRTFARHRLDLRALIERDALDPATAQLLEAMVRAGVAIAVSGATGTGKTTLLNVRQLHQPSTRGSGEDLR
jgi:pilus assembly protein CpaF